MQVQAKGSVKAFLDAFEVIFGGPLERRQSRVHRVCPGFPDSQDRRRRSWCNASALSASFRIPQPRTLATAQARVFLPSWRASDYAECRCSLLFPIKGSTC